MDGYIGWLLNERKKNLTEAKEKLEGQLQGMIKELETIDETIAKLQDVSQNGGPE